MIRKVADYFSVDVVSVEIQKTAKSTVSEDL